MPLRKTKLISGEIYHIYNRGVDKRDIFMDDEDHFRFIHDLYEFNDIQKIKNLLYFLSKNKYSEVGLHYIKKERDKFVEILAYCLMNNHFHLLVRQNKENGITEFMRKIGTGYTNYFNKKYERSGSLFQGKFKSVHIENDAHLLYLPIYIHLNPLDYYDKEWRNKKIKDKKGALEYLSNYRWSSLLDYIGKKNFPSIISKDFLLDRLGGEQMQKEEILNWIKSFDKNEVKNIIIEI